jgi:haloacetate dehalogenase
MSDLFKRHFPGFHQELVSVSDVGINVVHGGSGPPLLLIHGYPQNFLTWHKIASRLAQDFTVVATDLRGYGGSDKPFGTPDHATYSKRAMAQDQVDVMSYLGFDEFAVAGHDRGGRVALRLALDHPQRVTRLAVLDILPTAYLYENTSKLFATLYYHWFFLIQPYDIPERLISADPEFYLRSKLQAFISNERGIDEEVFAEYLRIFSNPEAVHAMCEDYRASATLDLKHDAEDATQKLSCPLLALWGEHGVIGGLFEPESVWREKADHLVAKSLPCGHFLPEELPDETYESLVGFFE